MRTKTNLLYSTFIGLHVEIANSSQQSLIGTSGRVVDETKNLIVVEKHGGKEMKIPKVSCEFRFTLDDGTKIEIDGRKIAFRPEERAKKV